MTEFVVPCNYLSQYYSGGFPKTLFSHDDFPACDSLLTEFKETTFLVLCGPDLQISAFAFIQLLQVPISDTFDFDTCIILKNNSNTVPDFSRIVRADRKSSSSLIGT